MISDIICVFLLLCRIYFSISVDDDIAKGFLPQNFAVYIGNAFALRYGNIMFALPWVPFTVCQPVRRVKKINITLPALVEGFQLIWKSLGIDAALKEKGIQEGQTVRIRDMVFEFKEY